MIVYRLSRRKWAKDLNGEGAWLFGGRWNHPGTPCVYTSENRALALVEYTVNVNLDDIPRALSMVTIEIPDEMEEFPLSELPGDWNKAPAPVSTKDFGTEALKSLKVPVLKFPSAVIPQEYNFLLNPLHPKKNKFKIVDVSDFVYDLRIKER